MSNPPPPHTHHADEKKYYGQFDLPVDRFIFERYFPDKNIKGIFVECGAFDGLTECSCKFFEESMAWDGYNIEPVPWVFEKLCENRPGSKNYNFALSDHNGTGVFKAVDHPVFGVNCTNGSLSHTERHANWLEEIECKIVELDVKLRTWSDFVSEERVPYVDLLVLDVEGHELSVIEGMQEARVLPDLICIEIGHLDFNSIRSALEKLGYVYDISSYVNAFFVKLEKLPLFALRRIDCAKVRPEVEIFEVDPEVESNMAGVRSCCFIDVIKKIKKHMRL
ncbi:hypothetical protein FACS189441_7040 [Betaproteobacteria bacterium]|nr:hypothetical protein FACS189441_7040 [Betaproteobacteria bacterium]